MQYYNRGQDNPVDGTQFTAELVTFLLSPPVAIQQWVPTKIGWWHRGRLVDVILYAIRPQDQNLLWLLAEKRAHNARVFYHQITEERAEESPYCRRYIDHRQL
ncbi:hypothetical protein C2W62_39590 [Candidatus Entotheonella serta]|nr:hypothetical protein C2W62_39590 [Candidatus Entotheonella serta]